MLEFYDDTTFDAYLDGALSTEDLELVEAKLLEDEAYADALTLHKKLRRALQLKAVRAQMTAMQSELESVGFYEEQPLTNDLEHQTSKAVKQKKTSQQVLNIQAELEAEGFFQKAGQAAEAKTKGKVRRMTPFVRYFSVAASVALLVAAFFVFQNNGNATDRLFAKHFEAAPDQMSESIALLMEGQGFATDKAQLKTLEEAMKAYNKKSYVEAEKGFSQWLAAEALGFDRNEVLYYQAACLLANNKPDAAKALLEPLANNTNFVRQTGAKWYLALSLLKSGELKTAKPIFESLSKSKEYGASANAILSSKIMNKTARLSTSIKQKAPRFELEDIEALSIQINPKNGVLSCLEAGNKLPDYLQIDSLDIDVFNAGEYAGSFHLSAGETMKMEELDEDELLVFARVILVDTVKQQRKSWNRVPYVWLKQEAASEESVN